MNPQQQIDPLWKQPKVKLDGLCQTCGSDKHYAAFCFLTKKKVIKQFGKRGVAWFKARKDWVATHPPDENGFWYCHYCGVPLTIEKSKLGIGIMFMTLDHKHGRKGELLTAEEHIVPACYPDNRLKGSTDYARFIERHYPHLLLENEKSTPERKARNGVQFPK